MSRIRYHHDGRPYCAECGWRTNPFKEHTCRKPYRPSPEELEEMEYTHRIVEAHFKEALIEENAMLRLKLAEAEKKLQQNAFCPSNTSTSSTSSVQPSQTIPDVSNSSLAMSEENPDEKILYVENLGFSLVKEAFVKVGDLVWSHQVRSKFDKNGQLVECNGCEKCHRLV